ncbi:hypothetical protein F503_05823 [Ophiostoma piceae UAMH 11346]|uniref:ER membrane protein complex subunit 4 n=1 Tax=Ophiostoma piceae (strain UAMH 11346) TaxID=1262450 RepID=S3CVL3_OPHP1|nr:hypothetical protein F503_05823 [Ophiostoma piceae UAMH 11346]
MSELTTSPTATPRWVADLKSPPTPRSKGGSIPDPPGFAPQTVSSGKKRDAKETKAAAAAAAALAAKKKQTPEELETLKVKKAWEVALGPLKSLPMTGIMMYMSGNSLQIFSIMMVFMAFKNPIMGLLSTQQAFERFETPGNRGKILQVKLAFVAMQFVALALGVWKINGMGLLPTTRSDWLAWETPRDVAELAIPAL